MDRLSGYISTLKKNNIDVRDSLIEHSDFTIESGYRACKKLLKNNPDMTALFATNYDTTMGAMMVINEYGVSVPDELSVFGFDDMPFAKVIKPHLSVIAQPISDIGKYASQALLERMNDNSDAPVKITVLRTQKILRDSVGTPYKKEQ
jgi:LacI family transcriptional regulator